MKKICFFAGHSKLFDKEQIYQKLLSAIENLIVSESVAEFWVGNYGDFDRLCAGAVRKLKEKYPGICLNLIIPYLTKEINEYKEKYYSDFDCILMADIPLNTPKKFQISKCNEYAVNTADFLVCFVDRCFGGAAKTLEYAKNKHGITILNLAEEK